MAGATMFGRVCYNLTVSSPGKPLRFTKMEAAGNDFVLLDDAGWPAGDWERVAQAVCDRRFGVGADGLLVVSASEHADFRFRMFNPDGTEDHCGNGLRCAFVYYAAGQPGRDRFTAQTLAGVREGEVLRGTFPPRARVDMGEPALAPGSVPAAFTGDTAVDVPLEVGGETILITSLSTGTAHTVVFAPHQTWAARFERLSPLIELHPAFPERTSVLWVDSAERGRLRLRIWERGVGETLSCGTGACAAAVAWRLHGGPDRVDVASQGGTLTVDWPGHGPILLEGTARTVFTGEMAAPDTCLPHPPAAAWPPQASRSRKEN